MPRRDSEKKNANGQGSIWQRADGRYGAALVYEYYDGAQGRTVKKRASTTKPDWDAAHKWLVGKQSDLLGGVTVSDENPALSDFLDDWLQDVVEPSVARNTYLEREYNLRTHLAPALGRVRIKDLDPRRIQALYKRLRRREPPLAVSTRREVHVTLKMALSQAVRWGLIGRNPADLVDSPKEPKARKEDGEDAGEVRALTDAQARVFFRSAAGKRWRHYYVAAVRTGLRPGELLGLRWGDLSLDADPGSLKVHRTLDTHEGAVLNPPKSDASRRTLALHWEAAEAFGAAGDAFLRGSGHRGERPRVPLNGRDADERGQPPQA